MQGGGLREDEGLRVKCLSLVAVRNCKKILFYLEREKFAATVQTFDQGSKPS